jgi:hypothetical protein
VLRKNFDLLLSDRACRILVMVSLWSAPCDTPTRRQATLVLGGYPELDEVLAATGLQAEGVFELLKNFLEFGRIGDGDRLHAKLLDWIFQTLRHFSRQSNGLLSCCIAQTRS